MTTSHEPLLSFRDALTQPGEIGERLLRACMHARQFLDDNPLGDLLELALEQPRRRRAIGNMVRAINHVGFLAPRAADLQLVTDTARAAGFGMEQVSFPSRIFSAELGMRLGRAAVPATVFVARRQAAHGATAGVEVFIPDEQLSEDVVSRFVDEEVGTHCGLLLEDHAMFDEAVAHFQAEGFRVPPFLASGPATNDAHRVTVVYLDGERRGRALRIELLWFSPDV